MTTTRMANRRRPALEALEGRALLAAGALDTTFGGTGVVVTALKGSKNTSNYRVNALVVQPDLKTVTAGFDLPTGTGNVYTTAVVRYNVNGSLDTSFGTKGVAEITTNTSWDGSERGKLHNVSVALQADGKIVVATNTLVTKKSVTKTDMMVLRLNPNGSLDTSFGTGGNVVIDLPQGSATPGGVAVLPGGQIVVAGSNPFNVVGPEYVVARLTSAGALDTSFGPSGQGYNFTVVSPTNSPWFPRNTVEALGVDPSGDLVLAGNWTNPAKTTSAISFQVVRYTPGGLLDTSFANQGVFIFPFPSGIYGIESVGFQPDGHIILGLPDSSGMGTGGVARLNTNGTIDTTFGSNGYFTDPAMADDVASTVQTDGNVLLELVDGDPNLGRYLVDRLLPGGTLDPAFGSGGQVVVTVPGVLSAYGVAPPVAITVGPDGKITSEGNFTSNLNSTVTIRMLNDITSNAAQPLTAAGFPATALLVAVTPDLVAEILNGPNVAGALLAHAKRRGG
jgi:uncharacterized delta-60 repeat protein